MEKKFELCGVLNVPELVDDCHYLGLPLLIGRQKKEAFEFVKENMHKSVMIGKDKNSRKQGRRFYLKQ